MSKGGKIRDEILLRHKVLVRMLGTDHDKLYRYMAICYKSCDCISYVMSEHGYKCINEEEYMKIYVHPITRNTDFMKYFAKVGQ